MPKAVRTQAWIFQARTRPLMRRSPQFMAPMEAHPKGLSSIAATSGPRLLGVLR